MPTKQKWQEGKDWERLLKIYDGIAKEQFESSQLIPTRFGMTQVHTCGNPMDPPLVFFHGIATNSLMFGEWLFPKLVSEGGYYCVACDTLGDMGRSVPRDNDPTNCPENDQEMADWAIETLDQVFRTNTVGSGKLQPFSIVGYSMGAFIGTCVSRYYPERVQKLICLAPAGVVAPVRKTWLAQAIFFAIVSKLVPPNGSIANYLRVWFFGSMMADVDSMKNLKYPELRQASDAAGSAQLNVQPRELDVETLSKMTKQVPTLLVIGKQESVIDPNQAIETAYQSNMHVKVYDNAGHMFFCEHPRQLVIDDIILFLAD